MKLGIVILAGIFLLAVFGVLYYYVFTGIVMINSLKPLDAIVKVDDNEIGTTPLKYRLRSGTYNLKVYKEGFETWEGQITISGTAPQTLTVKMRFLIKSEPSGATVKINGKEAGVTDMPIDLSPGVYTFEFQKKGYGKVKYMAEIPHNVSDPLPIAPLILTKAIKAEQAEAIASAMPTQPTGYGSVQVTSNPDAQVYLDGTLQGETPLTLPKVSIGSYVLKLSKEGYKDQKQTVYVNKGEITKVAGELKPE
jgi:hypothetical protein